jgi:hypothetical protein
MVRVRVPLLIVSVLLVASYAAAAPIVVSGCGNITPRLAEYRALLGDASNGGGPPNASGRREINWDGVGAANTNTNTFPGGAFAARGLQMSSLGTGLRVSDNNFSDVNAAYTAQFAAFSPAKTFAAIGSSAFDLTFVIPATTTPATVNGFGIVFSDVDTLGSTRMEFYSGAELLGSFNVPVRCDSVGHSFLGVVFNEGERVTRVRVIAGNAAVAAGVNDVSSGGASDVVITDDFLYSEPVAGDEGNRVLTAALLGTNEVPGPGDADGSGFAVVSFDPDAGSLSFAINVANISAPTLAHIHTGGPTVAGGILINFNPTFTNNIATGTITGIDAGTINSILANPGGFYVNVHNADFPAGAVRGQLEEGAEPGTKLTLPVVARVPGAAGTSYRSDLRLVNQTGAAAPVLVQFYTGGGVANSAPAHTETITLAVGEQRAIDDIVSTLFHVENGSGALQLFAPRGVIAVARIYNDQRAAGQGTFGQFEPGVDDTVASRSHGVLPGLSSSPIGSGPYRTNIGFFNASNSTAAVALRAHGPDGAVLATTTIAVPAFGQSQSGVTALFPSLGTRENFYVTYNTDTPTVYVYASVIDNVNGDAIFIHAQ